MITTFMLVVEARLAGLSSRTPQLWAPDNDCVLARGQGLETGGKEGYTGTTLLSLRPEDLGIRP